MRKRRIKHNFEIYKVVDNIYVKRCYNCFGFNHNASDCKNAMACPRCAGNHKSDQCQSQFKRCVNCMKVNENLNLSLDTNHESWDKRCHVYKNKLEKSKNIFGYKQ